MSADGVTYSMLKAVNAPPCVYIYIYIHISLMVYISQNTQN